MSKNKEREYITSSIKRKIDGIKRSSSLLEYSDIRAYASTLSELRRIDKVKNDEKYCIEGRVIIKSKRIKALELLERHEEAQKERISLFDMTLDFSAYKAAMQHTPPELRDKFVECAINRAFNSGNPLISLKFLSDAGYLNECSMYVFEKINCISGKEDKILLKIADKLRKNNYYLSAVLIYRKIAEDLTVLLKSSYYRRAIKALHACVELDKQVNSYNGIQSHSEFWADFQNRHKKKLALWGEYETYKASKGG